MSTTAPLGFLSYSHEDDRSLSGWITQFRVQLEAAVRAKGHGEFVIFQDKRDLHDGEQWQQRITESLAETIVLVPMLTPRYLGSAQCRRELQLFLDRERALRRNDLILSAYVQTTPEVEKPDDHPGSLAAELARRIYSDWRQYISKHFSSSEEKERLERLAAGISRALLNTSAVPRPGAVAQWGAPVPVTDHVLILNNLRARNAAVEAAISRYTTVHASVDAGVGLLTGGLGFGAGLVVTAGLVAAAVPMVYQPLVREIGDIYLSSPDRITAGSVRSTVAYDATANLAADFSVEFLTELAPELLQETALATVGAFIPVIGAFASAALGGYIAAHMTRRVGAMASLYYQNGQRWVNGRRGTYDAVKDRDDDSLDDIARRVPEVDARMVETVMSVARGLWAGGLQADAIKRVLLEQHQFPPRLVDEAMRRLSQTS